MRSVSNKRARLMRRVRGDRQAFLEEQRLCWCCEQAAAECVDEIARGTHREAALSERLAWFSACGVCNTGPLADPGEWPMERKLAQKKLMDPDYYDLEAFNRLRGRAPGAITEEEVDAWIDELGQLI